jgi:hypothetical protein
MKVTDQFKSIQIIFYAMIAGQLIFLFISVFLVQSGNISTREDLFLILFVIDLMIIVPAIVIGPIFYRSFMNRVNYGMSVSEKLNLFRQGTIIKLALVEAPTIFSILGFLLTASVVFLIIAVGVLILFFFHKPTLEKFAEDFKIPLSDLK